MIVIPENRRRNHQMVVFHNTGPDGKKASITKHLPIDQSRPCINRQFLGKAAAKGNLR